MLQGEAAPAAREAFEDEVGVERDPEECLELEMGPLCKLQIVGRQVGKAAIATSSLKRKRV
jgi:hypothetical protein